MRKNKADDKKRNPFLWKSLIQLVLVIVAVCIVFETVLALQKKYALRVDLTPSAITTLSQETKEILKQVEEPVTIHLIFQQSNESELRQILQTLTQQYVVCGGEISVETIDP
ncbi:MAG: hypothetical protein GX786_05915, partial [Clostridiales bacterium]|nr:hypothetical protein [Clostridiales bacterium]